MANKLQPLFTAYKLRGLIESTLDSVSLKSPEKVINLLLGTAAHESHMGKWLKQINGPAVGLFQMEPATLNDLKENYLKYRKSVQNSIKSFTDLEDYIPMEYNFQLQIIYARLQYMRFSESIPESLEDQAVYYKKYWNTFLGKGTPEEYLKNYKRFIENN